MHKYLRAIGFSKYILKHDIKNLLAKVEEEPTNTLWLNGEIDKYCLMDRSFGRGIGLRVFGSLNEDGSIEAEYYYPYVESSVLSSTQNCSIERHTDRMSFGGIIEDPSMGISLIFYLSNGLDLVDRQRKEKQATKVKGVSLNGLCIFGKILLPIYKTEHQTEKRKAAADKRGNLLKAAQDGDEKAMERLAIEDMNIFQNVNRRIEKEDIYSIVDTSFMPYGLESDQYSVLGEIQEVEKLTNRMTGEECYRLTMECNNLLMTVTINSADLLGVPMVGRRFKGDIWLQGTAVMD